MKAFFFISDMVYMHYLFLTFLSKIDKLDYQLFKIIKISFVVLFIDSFFLVFNGK